MAILDYEYRFSVAQAFTSTGDTDSTNIVDTGVGEDFFGSAKPSNVGEGGDAWLHVDVDAAFTSAAPLTGGLTIALHDSATVGGTYTELFQVAKDVQAAALTLGTELVRVPVPAESLRFWKLIYTTGTTVWTAGALNAHVRGDGAKSINS